MPDEIHISQSAAYDAEKFAKALERARATNSTLIVDPAPGPGGLKFADVIKNPSAALDVANSDL